MVDDIIDISGTFYGYVYVEIYDSAQQNVYLQYVEFSAQCNGDLELGDKYGAFELVGFETPVSKPNEIVTFTYSVKNDGFADAVLLSAERSDNWETTNPIGF